MSNQSSARPVYYGIARYVLYTAMIGVGLEWLLKYGTVGEQAASFAEGSMAEWLQVALTVSTVGVLLDGARRARQNHWLLMTASALAAIAAVRELDYLFDAWIPVLGWQLPAVVMFGAAVCCGQKAWERRTGQMLMNTAAVVLLWAGWLIVVIFAQIAGQADVWREVMGEMYTRSAKRTFEEVIEVLGYMLIFVGAIELSITAVMQQPESEAGGHEAEDVDRA